MLRNTTQVGRKQQSLNMSTIRPEEDPLARLTAELDPTMGEFSRFTQRIVALNRELADKDDPLDPDDVEELVPDLDSDMPFPLESEVYVTGSALMVPMDHEGVTSLSHVFMTKANLRVNGVELQDFCDPPEIFYSFLCKIGKYGYEAPSSADEVTHIALIKAETCHIEKIGTTADEVGAELAAIMPKTKAEIDARLEGPTDIPAKLKSLGTLSITHTSAPHSNDLFQQRVLLTMYLGHSLWQPDIPPYDFAFTGLYFEEDAKGEFDIEKPKHSRSLTEHTAWLETVGAMPRATFEEPDVVAINSYASMPVVVIRECDPLSTSPEHYIRRIAIPLSKNVTIK